MPSIASAPHNRRRDITTDSWVTPKWLVDRLGPFDLDPCACDPQPWPTAAHMVTEREDGLLCLWHGLVWLNPPYHRRRISEWMERAAIHNNGIALLFARTDTRVFHKEIWPVASAMLFLRGRVTFCAPDGKPAKEGHNSGGPSVLVAYGAEAAARLRRATDLGAFVHLRN